MNKIGLLCEGGGTKGAYTSGVLQCFLDNDIIFPYCVGISAGAVNLMPYVSRQPERLRVTGVDSASQKGAIGIIPLLREGGIFGIHQTYNYIEKHAPLNYEKFHNSSTKFDIGIYNLDTNLVEYKDSSEFTLEKPELIKASCALLMLARPVKINDTKYMDAGLIDMIPIEQSIRAGNTKHVFISTKEENYIRKPAPTWQMRLSRFLFPRNKQIAEDLKIRHENYAKQWNIIKELEKENKVLVLRPSMDMGITRTTQDKDKLDKWYDLGYQDTLDRLDLIREFIK